jgi:predicted phosphodiesterase
MRLFATSDLHVDFKENRLLIERLSDVAYQNDALILAGDIADHLETIKDTLSLLCSKFWRVFFTPGNHELWVRTDNCNSIEKLHKILALCEQLGVHTRPAKIDDTWIVPLFSWFDSAFCGDSPTNYAELALWADFHFCKWPAEVGELSKFFLGMNERNIKRYDARVISFSHFLPRRELLPNVRYLRFKGLPKVAGSAALDEQIRRLGSSIHVFGHSHIRCDRVIDGVRYVQYSLRYPKERIFSSFPIKMISKTTR